MSYPTEDDLDEFKKEYLEHHGIELTDEQALIILGGAMRFIYVTEVRPYLNSINDKNGPARTETE